MKNILLINTNTEIYPYPVAPIGISLLASSVKNNYNVHIFDSAFNSTKSLLEFAENFNPDYIGIGLRNIDNVTMNKCKWYIKDIRDSIVKPVKENFNTPLIIGGSGFSIAPVEILHYFDADYGIVGEAEEIFPQLISALEKGINDIKLERLISKKNKYYTIKPVKKNTLEIPRANIDQFIDFKPYNKRGNYPIQTKRGCAHKCIYCSYPNIEGKQYRLRNVKNIVDEIEEVSARIPGVTFEFVDSIFNSPLNHALNICKEIKNRKLKVQFRAMGINPGEVTEELMALMKECGFSQIDCTPDTASEKMLKNYKKNFGIKKLIHAAQIIKKYDMPTMWFFMMGAPGENKKTIMETFDFIDKHVSHKDMAHITEGIRIIPNTELFNIALKEGIISTEMNIIEPIFYVSPGIGKKKLSQIIKTEINKRKNTANSTNTSPTKQLMEKALKYREQNSITEPMFRTLLRIQKQG